MAEPVAAGLGCWRLRKATLGERMKTSAQDVGLEELRLRHDAALRRFLACERLRILSAAVGQVAKELSDAA